MCAKKNIVNRDLNEGWPVAGLEPVSECPVCESSDRRLLHENLQDEVFYCAPGSWNLYFCIGCGVAYLDPRPNKESIGLAYSVYYTHKSSETGHPRGIGEKAIRCLANGYRNWRYGTTDKPASILGVFMAMLWPNGRAMIDTGMRHLPKVQNGQRLLDIGCGSGAFLRKAKSAGWEVTGIDFDVLAVKQAVTNGLDVRHGDIDVLNDMQACFDYITMGHVIEHVHDPVYLIDRCFSLLKPGGVLWLETPNVNSLGHERFGRSWRGLEPPRHLVLFSPESLSKVLEKSGFESIQVQPYRAVAKSTFPASYAIQNAMDPYCKVRMPAHFRRDIYKAVEYQRNHPGSREFVTVKATRPIF